MSEHRAYLVRCSDERIPEYLMTRADARVMAAKCDEMWPICSPHRVVPAGADRDYE